MKKEYKQSASNSNLNKINTMGYLTQYVVLPLKSENKLPEEHFKWRDIMDVRDLYYSKPCRPVRIKPHDDHPILNDATRDFLSSWDKQGLKRNEYARAKYDWLQSQEDDWYHPSQSVVMGDKEAPMFFEPGSVKSFVQYEKGTGYFDIWDKHNDYVSDHLSFDEWLSGYKYGEGTTVLGYSITNTKDEIILRLSPMWDRDNFTKWLNDENEFSKSKGA